MEEKQIYYIEIRFSVHGTISEVKEKASQITQLIDKYPEVIGTTEVVNIEEDFGDDFEEDLSTTKGSEVRRPTVDDSK